MAKDKIPNGEQPPLPKGENFNGEIDRRLTTLEKSTADLNNRIFDSHKWFVTVLFSAVAVLLGVYGVMSRLDVRDSTNEMQQKVDKATSEMEKKVQSFVGEALKKPFLEVVTADDQPLDGTTNIVFDNRMGNVYQIYTVFLKNTGDKRTEPISVRYSLGQGFEIDWDARNDWEQAPAGGKDFLYSFYSRRTTTTIAAGQKLNVQPLIFHGDLSRPALCELEVFYGGEKPVRIRFYLSNK
jgi:hypothetical protein